MRTFKDRLPCIKLCACLVVWSNTIDHEVRPVNGEGYTTLGSREVDYPVGARVPMPPRCLLAKRLEKDRSPGAFASPGVPRSTKAWGRT